MSLQTRLAELVAAIGADIKALRSKDWSEQILSTAYSNSTTTASDVFGGFTPTVNSRYIIEATLAISAAASTTGVVLGLSGPTSGIVFSTVRITQWMSTTTADRVSQLALNGFTAGADSPSTANTPTIATVQAIVETATVGAGNIRIQARSEIAGSAIAVRPGSMMRWRKL